MPAEKRSGKLAIRRWPVSVALITLSALAAGALTPSAAAAGTALQVSARVLSYLRLDKLQMPEQLMITPAHIAQGYVDLEQPLEVHVKTNNPRVTLAMSLHSPAFNSATVSGPSTYRRITRLSPNLVALNQGQGMNTHVLSFRVRLELSQQATPGLVTAPFGLYLSPE